MTAKYPIVWMYQNLCHVHECWTAFQMLRSFKYLSNEYLWWKLDLSFLLLLENSGWRVRTLFLGSCCEHDETSRKTIPADTCLRNGRLYPHHRALGQNWLNHKWSLLIWSTKYHYDFNLHFSTSFSQLGFLSARKTLFHLLVGCISSVSCLHIFCLFCYWDFHVFLTE